MGSDAETVYDEENPYEDGEYALDDFRDFDEDALEANDMYDNVSDWSER